MRLALALALAACTPPPPPAPLSSTAPDTSHEPALLYWLTSDASRANELHWIDARGSSGGAVERGGPLMTLFSPVTTPRGTWLDGQAAMHGDNPYALVLARRQNDGVVLQQFRMPSIASVSPDGTWAVYPCEPNARCAVGIASGHPGTAIPLAAWKEGDIAVGWSVDHLVVEREPGTGTRELFAIDLLTGARRRILAIPEDDEVADIDPTGRAALVFVGGGRTSAYVAALDGSGRRFAVDLARPTPDAGWLQCYLPVAATAVCSELHRLGDRSAFAIAAYTADGRREIGDDTGSPLAVGPDGVAYFDKTQRALVATDLRGERRRVLRRASADEILSPVAWVP